MIAKPEKSKDQLSSFEKEGPDEDLDFAGSLKRLEEIVEVLESGELSLEESLAKFEEGVKLARRLEAILDRAERRIQEILKPEESCPDKEETL